MYPPAHSRVQCRAGDVLGSLLDLDNGLCTFFINGCDLGLTVAFEYPLASPRRRRRRLSGRHIKLGLYPAVSLTTHQHILINLGDRPWIYPPPVTVKYKGVSEAGRLTEKFKRRVLRYAQRHRPRYHNDNITTNSSSSNDSNTGDYDWDGPLCTICFSEPKNILLLPCRHTGWGKHCADALKKW